MTEPVLESLSRRLRIQKPQPDEFDRVDFYTLSLDQWKGDVLAVALVCQEEAPRFDRAKFLDACTYPTEED